ncbi:MAG: OmpA family protein [Pseudomonadota bacterium]
MVRPFLWPAMAATTLMVAACATPLEADGRLETTRDRVQAASEYGTSNGAYSRAQSFLSDAETAFEAGDATAYDKTVELGDAYAQVAIAEGEAREAKTEADEMRGQLDGAEAEAARLEADLAAALARASEAMGASSQALALLSGTMKCTSTTTGSGAVAMTCPGLAFGFDQAALNAATDARLTALSEFLKANGSVNVELVGHTDATGDEGWNQALSTRRADAVSDFLQAEGVDASRISTSGQGEAAPIASNDTRAGRAQNRRVDVVLSGVASPETSAT